MLRTYDRCVNDRSATSPTALSATGVAWSTRSSALFRLILESFDSGFKHSCPRSSCFSSTSIIFLSFTFSSKVIPSFVLRSSISALRTAFCASPWVIIFSIFLSLVSRALRNLFVSPNNVPLSS
ncbi:hypothetical protein PUN28_003207 [Cardiocondyla obscurior]|uniref:Uncharacterized protein n=1 Tax=Cardiocondyla obscurior TaxID=286306 RepID=A0AAW2GJX7_9HYME